MWREQLTSPAGRGDLTREDAALLLAFGETLGTTDLEGQIAHCRLTAERLAERLCAVRADAGVKMRMYPTLGAAGGMAVALLLL